MGERCDKTKEDLNLRMMDVQVNNLKTPPPERRSSQGETGKRGPG